MKIIQVPFCFYPDRVGGTEVYVEALAARLQSQGVNIAIAAPGDTNQTYQHQKLTVHRFALSPQMEDLRHLYGEGDPQAAREFSHLLDREQPDLVHLHAFTPGVSLRLVRAAQQRQIPVVFTYHTPTVSCQRGTLLQGGTEICNGKLDLHTCSRCTLESLGIDPVPANLIGSLPTIVGKGLGALHLQGGLWTALRMTDLVQCRQTAFHNLMREVDHVVAVCAWVEDVLLLNQVTPEKISVIRQGLCHSNFTVPPSISRDHSPLKMVFLGRLDRTKGIHILIEALATIPDLPITLDIYGVSQAQDKDAYQEELFTLARLDSRISFKPSIPTADVMSTLTRYDLLAVPSQWLETGPLVVLEAFAAGVPVLGSRLGGIAELVQDGVNGVLVEPRSIKDWARAMENLYRDRSQLAQLRSGISPPTNMEVVADRMMSIYHLLITKK